MADSLRVFWDDGGDGQELWIEQHTINGFQRIYTTKKELKRFQ